MFYRTKMVAHMGLTSPDPVLTLFGNRPKPRFGEKERKKEKEAQGWLVLSTG